MAPPLDVLLIESRPRAGDDARVALRSAGHRVHECYDPGAQGFPCRGLLEADGCPLDGGVDVALLVRPRVLPRPSTSENGAVCAIRNDVPLAEQGSPVLDPFEPWVTTRVARDEDVAAACAATAAKGFEPLRREIMARAARLLLTAGEPVDTLACRIERHGSRLAVRLQGPDVDNRLRQAMALHVLAAVQVTRRPADPLDVDYIPTL